MEIKVKKLTGISYVRWACSLTTDGKSAKNVQLEDIYKSEHSPMRTQLFVVEMNNIPAFVSVHFVRHTQGVVHFCKSLREDRGGTGNEDRWTLTRHGMMLNAQALVNMARKRLCYKSHPETVKVMKAIKKAVNKIDPALGACMVPECVYRGSCHEKEPCGIIRRLDEIV